MMSFRFADASDLEALRRFSMRLRGTTYAHWPLTQIPLPGAGGPDDSFPVRRRRLIVEHDGEIRAMQNFYEHELYVDGKPHPFVWPNGPLSEAVIDPKYTSLGLALLKHSLSLQPLHLAFGSLPPNKALVRVYAGLGWTGATVPLWVHPINVRRMCASLGGLRSTRLRAFLATVSQYSGVADFASTVVRVRRYLARREPVQVEEVEKFGDWADSIWLSARNEYRVLTRRDAATLNRLYRPGDLRIKRLRIMRAGCDIGWIILGLRSFRGDATFGRTRTGLLADGLGKLADVVDLMAAALQVAIQSGADLCFGYWGHQAWRNAAKTLGFFQVPTDTMLYVSPAGKALLLSKECPLEVFHITRGDCDGPQAFIEPENRSHPLERECVDA